MSAQPHKPDIKALLRLGVVQNIPKACEKSTADVIPKSPLIHIDFEITVTDYKSHLKRKI